MELLDQAISWGVSSRPVVADSFYGNEFGFREKLRSRSLSYAVQVEPSTAVWDQDPNIELPASTKKGRPRRYPPLESLPQVRNLLALAQDLPDDAWQEIAWREGTRGPQKSRFALIKVWAAHGWRKQYHPDRVPELLLIEWPEGDRAPDQILALLVWFPANGNMPDSWHRQGALANRTRLSRNETGTWTRSL